MTTIPTQTVHVHQAISSLEAILVSFRQRVGVGVVKQTVVSISPGEGLTSNPQMSIRSELWVAMLFQVLKVSLLFLERAVCDNANTWKGYKD